MTEKKSERLTTILNKYPSFRDESVYGCWRYLEGRQADDSAEGLWRVHDKLYDLKDFKKIHPGGRQWLTLTEGTDITEAFESYHIRGVAAKTLPKYFIREASEPRNYKFTFKDDGFYRTLKRRAAVRVEKLDKTPIWKSNLVFDLVLLLIFVSAVLSVSVQSFVAKCAFGLLTAQSLAWISAISHNYIHQSNNWRMYGSCLTLNGWRDWRVFHGLEITKLIRYKIHQQSHHLYPNSFTDYEILMMEPFLSWIPIQKKTQWKIIQSYFATPIVYGLVFYGGILMRWQGYFKSKRQHITWDELIPLSIPMAMFLFGRLPFAWASFIEIIVIWNLVIIGGSFLSVLVGINAGHHGTEIVHEGDEFKSLDFGIYQMGAAIERIEAKSNIFMTLTHFGDHVLHHMFPSLDHALLPQMEGVFLETCMEFREELRKFSMLDALIGQFKQLGRTETIKLNTTE